VRAISARCAPITPETAPAEPSVVIGRFGAIATSAAAEASADSANSPANRQ
jgi:hypothetical protein